MNKLRRMAKTFWKPLLAVLISLIIGWLILLVAGYDAPKAFSALWESAFKDARSIGNVLNKACPLLFTGLAVAVAFRGNVFNIGAEGQFLLGAIAATWVGLTFDTLPGFLLIPLMILAGALGGALWGLIPGFLKARYGVSEVIVTIMFNYIALQLVGFLVRGPFKDTAQAEPQSFVLPDQGILSYLIPGTKLHIGFFLGVVVAVLLFILLFKTYYGYEIRAVGFNTTAARVGGISSTSTTVATMLLSGALAGVGGALELSGYTHYLLESISPGYGYTAIAVSILAANNPIGIIFSSLFFGVLSAGSTAMQRSADVSASFVDIFQGIIIIFVAIAAVAGTGVAIKKRKKKGEVK